MAKGRSSKAPKRKTGAKTGTKTGTTAGTKKRSRQLVITLSASSNDIEKIEELASTGKRRAFSEAEFAKLAGDDDLESVCEALEAAYMAGVQDGFADGDDDDDLVESTHEQEGTQESFGEEILRSGIRRIIFRRAIRRRLDRVGAQTAQNGGHAAR